MLPLIAPRLDKHNRPNDPMQPTEALDQCPCLKQVIASFDTVVGHSKLIRLAPNSTIPPHYDANYQRRHHVQIHIPIITDPRLEFSAESGGEVNMRPGEAWVFDHWRTRTVTNNSDTTTIHLVIQTTGTSSFWSMVARGRGPRGGAEGWGETLAVKTYHRNHSPDLLCERYHQTTVSSPEVIDNMLDDFLVDLQGSRLDIQRAYDELEQAARQFRQDWRSRWLLHGDAPAGLTHYKSLIGDFRATSKRLLGDALLANNSTQATDVLGQWLSSAMNEDEALRQSLPDRTLTTMVDTSLFDSPVFIVAAPRSGSTMLFELLKENRELWTIGDESHRLFESIRQLNPATGGYESNALTAEDLTNQIGMALFGAFKQRLRDAQGKMLSDIPTHQLPSSIRVLEKTPKNALRIPFIRKLFPNALFVYLHREPRPNMGSIIDAWMSENFVTYPNLPDWNGPPWSLLLPAGWRELRGRSLAEIAAWQWAATNQKIIDDLRALPDSSWHCVTYEDLLSDREVTLRGLCEFIDVPFGPRMQALSVGQVPHSKYTLEPPALDKWKRHQAEIETAISARAEVGQVMELTAGLS